MQITNYNQGEKLFDICTNEEQVKNVVTKSHNALLINDKATAFINDKSIEFEASFNNKDTFGYDDVALITQEGKVVKFYDGKTGSHTLVITDKCNSNCIMCPYTSQFRKNAKNPNLQFLNECVEYLPETTNHIVVTGGEPTLIGMDFFKIMHLINKRLPNVFCLLLTNGRSFAVDSMVTSAVESFPTLTQIAIPLHGASDKVHDRITQTPNSFVQTLEGIKNLLNTEFKIEIRVVVFKTNIDEMESIAELIVCKFPKTAIVNFMAAEMCGNAGLISASIWIDYNTAFQKCMKSIDILIENGIDVGLYNFPLCSVPEKYWGLYKKSISDYKIRYAGKCVGCSKKDLCGGIFASSLRYAQNDVISFK